MTLTAPYTPTPERVAVAVLAAISSAGVATSLPALPEVGGWRADGFITADAVDVSQANIDLPRRSSYLKVSCWAAPATSGSDKPQWNLAAGLAEEIRDGLDSDVQHFGSTLDVGVDFLDAYVYAGYLMTEPRRIENDPSAYARITFDLMIDWAVIR